MKEDYIYSWSTFVPEETGVEVEKVLRSNWINTGEQEKRFRQSFRERFNIPYCVATNNGTAALRASLAALGVGAGDEVVSTPYTFIATNTSILEQKATPVFADIQYDTLNIDPESIEEKITDRTKAIICVHYGGNPCDMDEIRKIGKDYGLPIIEDSAHAMGSRYRGDYIGSKGDIVCFSFQVVKIITCGDGGMVATANGEYYERLKRVIWYGVDRSKRDKDSIDPLPEQIDMLGFKYNMNDITATIGLVGLRHIDEAFQRRKEVGERYMEELSDCPRVQLPSYHRHSTPNYQIFPIHVENRPEFARHLKEHSIEARVNNRRNDRYAIFGKKRELPATERADRDVILLPIHASLTDAHVERIIKTVWDYGEKKL